MGADLKVENRSVDHGLRIFLCMLFRLLEQSGARYCVLQSWEGLPEGLQSDLHMVVHPRDGEKVTSVIQTLAREGYSPVQCFNYAVSGYCYVFFWFEEEVPKSAAVDIIFEHRQSGSMIPSGEQLIASRRKEGNFWVPSPECEFAYLLAMRTGKGRAAAWDQGRLRFLVGQLGRAQARKIAGKMFGRQAAEVVESCASGSISGVLSRLKRRPWLISLTRHPLKLIPYLGSEGLRRIRRWLQPTGLFVVTLGPDGVGKSTMIGMLVQQVGPAFHRSQVFHWRPMLLWPRKGHGTVTNPHGQVPRSPALAVASLLPLLLDYWFGYWLRVRPLVARSGLVVFDRYYHDLLVDPIRYRYSGPLWLVSLLRWVVPKPDLVFVLDASEEVIFSRKQEVAPAQTRVQRQNYLGLPRKVPCARVISTNAPAAQVGVEASKAVLEWLAQRLQCRQAAT